MFLPPVTFPFSGGDFLNNFRAFAIIKTWRKWLKL